MEKQTKSQVKKKHKTKKSDMYNNIEQKIGIQQNAKKLIDILKIINDTKRK